MTLGDSWSSDDPTVMSNSGIWSAPDASAAAALASDPSIGTPGLTLSDVAQLGSTALTLVQQVQLNQVNLKRAQAGLPLIDPNLFAARVQVGASQSTLAGGMGIAGILALGLIGFAVLSKR